MPEEEAQYYDIYLTDIQLHAAEPRKPTPWYRAVIKSLRSKKPGRFYSTDFTEKNGNFTLTFPLPPEIQRQKEEAEKAGKIVRLNYPKDGLKIIAGKDAIEKINAENKKRSKLLDKYKH